MACVEKTGRKAHLRPGHRGPKSPLSYHPRTWGSTEIREFYPHLEAWNIEISKEHTEISTVQNIFSFLNRKKEKENGKAPVGTCRHTYRDSSTKQVLEHTSGGAGSGSLKVVEGEMSFAKTLI